MTIKKWAFFSLLLCGNVSAAPLSNQNFSTWLVHEMQRTHVPGASIAVIKNYEIEWAKGFGLANKKLRESVTPNVLFQAGSISKPVSAMAALKSVQDDRLTLDENINEALTSWKVPDNDYTKKEKVTLRRLLTHTAGINVPGFFGYAKGERVPTLIEVLNGARPANSEAVRVVTIPGKHFKYSGGGYTIVQQVLSDLYQRPFNQVMEYLVLSPLGMSRSTFEQPLPPHLMKHTATPYRPNGEAVEGGAHTYIEQAAAGLWSTPADLAKFVITIQKSLKGDTGQVLNKHFAELMAVNSGVGSATHAGMGLTVGVNKYGKPAANGGYFTAMAENEGYSSMLIGSVKSGNGIVVMINMSPEHVVKVKKTQPNWEFMSAVVKKIATTENWV